MVTGYTKDGADAKFIDEDELASALADLGLVAVPAPPSDGAFVLQSEGGVLTWVEGGFGA